MIDELKRDLDNIEAGNVAADEAAGLAVDIYRLARDGERAAAEPWQELQKRAKNILGDIIVETGRTSWEGQLARCYVPAPGKSVTYDAKALDALCASNSYLAEVLAPHRREIERAGSLTIR
jgi:hypothetical protein